MFVASPVPDIQASHFDQSIFLGLLQDAFVESALAETGKETQNVEADQGVGFWFLVSGFSCLTTAVLLF
jgi:hypothetical protein